MIIIFYILNAFCQQQSMKQHNPSPSLPLFSPPCPSVSPSPCHPISFFADINIISPIFNPIWGFPLSLRNDKDDEPLKIQNAQRQASHGRGPNKRSTVGARQTAVDDGDSGWLFEGVLPASAPQFVRPSKHAFKNCLEISPPQAVFSQFRRYFFSWQSVDWDLFSVVSRPIRKNGLRCRRRG